MAETFNHRMQDLTENGIFVLTKDGVSNLRDHPLPSQTCSADETMRISTPELLGYFTDRGAEYVVEKCYASKNDFSRAVLQKDAAIVTVFNYGKRLGIFDESTEDAVFEVHAIADHVQNKTHYFLMPHRRYIDLVRVLHM